MGHSDATWDEARAGADAGASLATHLFNAMRPFRHRDPGIAGFVMGSNLTAGVIADGNHLAFETIGMLARIKAPDELLAVTDALAGLGMPPGRYRLADREYISDGTCGRLPDGTLSGSLLPLNLALRNLVVFAGLEPAVAVRLVTLNPARALGLEGSLGRVAVARAADLVLVDDGWEVLVTIAGGRSPTEPLMPCGLLPGRRPRARHRRRDPGMMGGSGGVELSGRFLVAPRIVPPLDPDFRPAVLARRSLEVAGRAVRGRRAGRAGRRAARWGGLRPGVDGVRRRPPGCAGGPCSRRAPAQDAALVARGQPDLGGRSGESRQVAETSLRRRRHGALRQRCRRPVRLRRRP